MAKIQKVPRPGSRRGFPIDAISVARALVVGDCLSFRRAAKLLGLQQSALSRNVSTLEDKLGVSLFERHRSGVRITNAGAHFLQQAREALAQLEDAAATAAAAGSGDLGYINIGIVSSIGAGYLHDLIQTYTVDHPGIVIQLREGAARDHVQLVLSRGLDLALVPDTVEAVDCDLAPLWTERIIVVLPQGHALASKETIAWPDLRNERLIFARLEGDPELWYRIGQHLIGRNYTPQIQQLDLGREALMHLVAMGLGVSLSSEAAAGVPFPGIIFRPIADPNGILGFSAVWLRHNDNPALRRFLSFARVLARQRKHAATAEVGDGIP